MGAIIWLLLPQVLSGYSISTDCPNNVKYSKIPSTKPRWIPVAKANYIILLLPWRRWHFLLIEIDRHPGSFFVQSASISTISYLITSINIISFTTPFSNLMTTVIVRKVGQWDYAHASWYIFHDSKVSRLIEMWTVLLRTQLQCQLREKQPLSWRECPDIRHIPCAIPQDMGFGLSQWISLQEPRYMGQEPMVKGWVWPSSPLNLITYWKNIFLHISVIWTSVILVVLMPKG